MLSRGASFATHEFHNLLFLSYLFWKREEHLWVTAYVHERDRVSASRSKWNEWTRVERERKRRSEENTRTPKGNCAPLAGTVHGVVIATISRVHRICIREWRPQTCLCAARVPVRTGMHDLCTVHGHRARKHRSYIRALSMSPEHTKMNRS